MTLSVEIRPERCCCFSMTFPGRRTEDELGTMLDIRHVLVTDPSLFLRMYIFLFFFFT